MLGAVSKRLVVSTARVLPNKAPLASIRRYATAQDDDKDPLLNLSFICPHRSLFLDKKVTSVTVPGAGGMMGISKNHIPSIAEMKPGLVTVDEAPGKQDKYFVSGGFTFVNTDKTCVINAVEAVPLDNLDPDAAKSGYSHYLAEYAKAADEEARAKAQIGLDVHKQMCFALGIAV